MDVLLEQKTAIWNFEILVFLMFLLLFFDVVIRTRQNLKDNGAIIQPLVIYTVLSIVILVAMIYALENTVFQICLPICLIEVSMMHFCTIEYNRKGGLKSQPFLWNYKLWRVGIVGAWKTPYHLGTALQAMSVLYANIIYFS